MKQEIAFKILCSGENVFLTGSAGTGKTFVINQYIDYLRERGVEPAIVAPTGIAASHIGGKTIHSFFSVGIREYIDDYYLGWMKRQLFLQKRLKNLKVLIIDEISMVSPELFISMDRILRAFQDENKPFGGIQVVLSGDFFQLPPVSKIFKEIKFVWQTDLWKNSNLKICYLKEKFRQSDDVLINILDEIRAGEVSEDSMDIFRSRYKKKLADNFTITKLYTHNIDVDRINNEELDKLAGRAVIFKASTKGSKQNIEKIFKGSLVNEEVRLRKEATVIFIKNNYEEGYINGTLGKIIGFQKEKNLPIVEILSGRKIVVSPEEWVLEDEKGKVKAVVKQFPLKLAWALTIHKSQGMTLDAAEIDLSKTFEIGQGYVALSRIKSIEGLRLMGLNDIALKVDELVLEMDEFIREESSFNFQEFQNIKETKIIEISEKFIIRIGGEIIEQDTKNKKQETNKNQKINHDKLKTRGTLEITKRMVGSKKTIEEIAKERNLSRETVIKHLGQIKKLLPEIDLDYLRPKGESLKLILKVVEDIKKKNNPDDFSLDGQIRLKPIFEALDEKISYDEIKLALLFL
ncbi:MAG: helix-turn-helix domain-containing protein [Parcubacteria group bacterium]|jgi:GTPase SAR1 family protein